MKDGLKDKIQLFYIKYRVNIMLIMGAVGILLLSADDLIPKKMPVSSDEYSITQYRTEMEKQLENVLSMVNGAGQVKVMITLEGSRENIMHGRKKHLLMKNQTLSLRLKPLRKERPMKMK